MIDIGDVVKIKPNFHHPSRVGQIATVIRCRPASHDITKPLVLQLWILFHTDKKPDWVNEYDVEFVEHGEIEHGIPIIPGWYDKRPVRKEVDKWEQLLTEESQPVVKEDNGKRYLEL